MSCILRDIRNSVCNCLQIRFLERLKSIRNSKMIFLISLTQFIFSLKVDSDNQYGLSVWISINESTQIIQNAHAFSTIKSFEVFSHTHTHTLLSADILILALNTFVFSKYIRISIYVCTIIQLKLRYRR